MIQETGKVTERQRLGTTNPEGRGASQRRSWTVGYRSLPPVKLGHMWS